jgi:hypothetical protein
MLLYLIKLNHLFNFFVVTIGKMKVYCTVERSQPNSSQIKKVKHNNKSNKPSLKVNSPSQPIRIDVTEGRSRESLGQLKLVVGGLARVVVSASQDPHP